MTRPLGTEFSININTGNYGAPAWAFIRGLSDIKLDIAPGGMIKSDDRSSSFGTEIPTRYKVEVNGTAFWNGGTGQTALRDAFVNGTALELAVLNKAAIGSGKGVRAEWAVTQFPLDFPLSDHQKVAFKLQPHADYTHAPTFYTDATLAAGTAEAISTKKTGTAASVNTAAGAPITHVQDVKLSLQPGAIIESSDRDSTFDVVKPSRFKVEAEVSFLWNPADTQLLAFYTAATTNAAIELFILDGPYATTGSWGVHSDWAVASFPIDAKLKDGQLVTVKLVPHGDGAQAPEFKTIT